MIKAVIAGDAPNTFPRRFGGTFRTGRDSEDEMVYSGRQGGRRPEAGRPRDLPRDFEQEKAMRCLSEADMAAAVSREELIDLMATLMRRSVRGGVVMPPRTHVEHGADTLLLMPCFLPEAFGTKLVTVFPGNAERGRPVVEAVMVLNDPETGAPRAIMNGRALTALRTGAVGGAAVRALTPTDADSLGLVGAGVQGFYQALFAAAARPLTDIHVFDVRTDQAAAFRTRLQAALPDLRVHQAASAAALTEASQIVVTATTSGEPVLPDDRELLQGRHYIGIGSFKPAMREFPQSLFGLVKGIFVDTEHAATESGDLVDPLRHGWIARDQIRPLGGLLGDEPDGNRFRGRTTLFKSVGMALFDVGAADRIYRNALRLGLGVDLAW